LLENGTNTVDGGPDDDAFWGGAGEDTVSGGPHRAGDVCFQYIETIDKCEFQRFDQYHQLAL